MTLSGHKTHSMLSRYNMVNETDQRQALRRTRRLSQEHGRRNESSEHVRTGSVKNTDILPKNTASEKGANFSAPF